MQNPTEQRPAFDERAALEELERLRGQIERYRAERRAAEEQFDAFVQAVKAPRDAASAAPAPDLVRRRMPSDQDVPAATPTPTEPGAEAPLAGTSQVATTAAPASARKPGRRLSRPVVVAGALLVIAGGGFVAWTQRGRPPQGGATAQPTPAFPATPAAGTATPPAPAAPAATAPSSAETELVTIRPVWLRVTVDGQRLLEREVPANTRVPLNARTTIVIRTGDAGAVRLSISGRDRGFLGREGEVVTRTFTVAQAPQR